MDEMFLRACLLRLYLFRIEEIGVGVGIVDLVFLFLRRELAFLFLGVEMINE